MEIAAGSMSLNEEEEKKVLLGDEPQFWENVQWNTISAILENKCFH